MRTRALTGLLGHRAEVGRPIGGNHEGNTGRDAGNSAGLDDGREGGPQPISLRRGAGGWAALRKANGCVGATRVSARQEICSSPIDRGRSEREVSGFTGRHETGGVVLGVLPRVRLRSSACSRLGRGEYWN